MIANKCKRNFKNGGGGIFSVKTNEIMDLGKDYQLVLKLSTCLIDGKLITCTGYCPVKGGIPPRGGGTKGSPPCLVINLIITKGELPREYVDDAT